MNWGSDTGVLTQHEPVGSAEAQSVQELSWKETEFGMVPVDWEVVTIEDICDKKVDTVDPKEIPETLYVSLGHLDSGDPKLNRWGSSTEVRSSKRRFAPGDVLYGKLRPYLDKAVLAEIDGVSSTDIIVLSATEEQTTPRYLLYNLHTKRFLEYAMSTSTGTNLPRTRWTSIRDFSLALPPLPEQRRIAGALRTIQDAIAVQDRVIDAARELKRSLMEQLFTYGPYREPAPTKETEIGEIPVHWELKKLGAFAKIGNGSTPKRSNAAYWKDGTIPWITSGKVHEEIVQSADEFVTEKAQDECHLPLVPSGSVVVAITGQGKTLGNAALVTFDTCMNQHLAYLEFQDNSPLPEYVFAYLQRQYSHLRQMGRAGGSTKRALTCGLLTTYPIPVPSKNVQAKIIKTDRIMRRKVEIEKQRKVALEELFRSALEQLMTGQIRLPV